MLSGAHPPLLPYSGWSFTIQLRRPPFCTVRYATFRISSDAESLTRIFFLIVYPRLETSGTDVGHVYYDYHIFVAILFAVVKSSNRTVKVRCL